MFAADRAAEKDDREGSDRTEKLQPGGQETANRKQRAGKPERKKGGGIRRESTGSGNGRTKNKQAGKRRGNRREGSRQKQAVGKPPDG